MPRLDLDKIDNLLASKYRLAILALLSTGDEIDFNYFKTELDVSDGNLSSHMTKLETAGYVTVSKRIEGKKPKTSYRITEAGIGRYESYLNEIAKLLKGGEG
jgi:DNA-binding HxlR family transcriptional regulator